MNWPVPVLALCLLIFASCIMLPDTSAMQDCQKLHSTDYCAYQLNR